MLRQSFLFVVLLAVVNCHQSNTPASPGQFPFVADIRTHQNVHLCSGFIVTNRWVVTVAHTLVGRMHTTTWVFVGNHESSTNVFSVLLAPHPVFWPLPDQYSNDVALIRTRDTIVFSATVQPIAMASATTPGGVQVTTVGWRPSRAQDWFYSETLTNIECVGYLPVNTPLAGSTLCSRRPSNNPNRAWPGDVLLVGNTADGLSSWRISGDDSVPDVYSRISTFKDWIISVIEC
ncbi:complement factor D-like [Phlebotomus argentipes]|uniref:complement factor D-like n=1 Tax=Phlebotomus argentipes TaxID=94469 RepID=UPI00289370C8|nr:complement factor D-like [Phlebotomus argentipes]